MSGGASRLADLRAAVPAVPAPAEARAALAVVDAAVTLGETGHRGRRRRAGAAVDRLAAARVDDAALTIGAEVARDAALAAIEGIATAVVVQAAAELAAGQRRAIRGVCDTGDGWSINTDMVVVANAATTDRARLTALKPGLEAGDTRSIFAESPTASINSAQDQVISETTLVAAKASHAADV